MEDDADLLTAMARELVTQQGVGEEAAAVWRALQQQREEVAPKAEMSEVPSLAEPLVVLDESESTPWIPIVQAEQFSLF